MIKKYMIVAFAAALCMGTFTLPAFCGETPSITAHASDVREFSVSADGDDYLSENFKVREFACHDGSDYVLIDLDLVDYLQQIRDHFGSPVTINSGYRSPSYNESVGGASRSYHVRGQAADIVVSGVSPSEVAAYAETLGMHGIGLYSSFTHVDTRDSSCHFFWKTSDQIPVSTFGGDPPDPDDHTEILKRGSRGDAVVRLQESLICLGYDLGGYGADGVFGAATEDAVMAFQYDHDLDADGIVGPLTQEAIRMALDPPVPDPDPEPEPEPVPTGWEMAEGAGQTLPDGDYMILSNLHPKFYLDIDGAESPAQSGTNVSLWEFADAASLPECDFWTLTYAGNGFYTISQKNAAICLDNYGGTAARGANVVAYAANGTNAQLWSLMPTESGYTIQNKCSGYYLDTNGSERGANIRLWEANYSSSQEWIFIPASDSDRISELVMPKTEAFVGERVPFYCKSNCAEHFVLHVLKDGAEYLTKTTDMDEIDIQFEEAGTYCVYVTAVSGAGEKASQSAVLTIRDEIKMQPNEQLPLSYDVRYTYKSANASVAVVSTSGVVTAFREGSTYITVIDNENNTYQLKLRVAVPEKGDCDGDGEVSVKDAVALQKWLLNLSGAVLADSQSVDMDQDGVVDIYDLALLKQALLQKSA